jgi:hypothetical protein
VGNCSSLLGLAGKEHRVLPPEVSVLMAEGAKPILFNFLSHKYDQVTMLQNITFVLLNYCIDFFDFFFLKLKGKGENST